MSIDYKFVILDKNSLLYNLLAKKLSGEATASELAELNNLLSNNYENSKLAQTLEFLWKDHSKKLFENNEIQEERFNYIIECLREEETEKTKLMGFWKKNRYWLAAASILPLIFFIVSRLTEKVPSSESYTTLQPKEEAITPPGRRKQMTLPDGTKAWLNAGSKLTYPKNFNAETREVDLEGEAYFDVVKNEEKPFIVHTSGIDIKVLGTVFNVKDYASDPIIEATLLRGMIEVVKKNEPGASKVILKPHEKLIFAKTFKPVPVTPGKVSVPFEKKIARPDISITSLNKNIADSAVVETAWVYNKLVFEEESFEDIALKMERWYNVSIRFSNERVKNFRLSGSFVKENISEALDVLQMLVPFSYVQKDGEFIIGKKRK